MTFPGSRAAFSRAELHFSSRLYFVTAVAPRWPIPQELADIDAGCGFTIGFFSLTLKPPITHTGPVPAWAPSGWHSLIPMEHPEPCGTAQQLLAHRSALVCSWWCSAASLPGHLHGVFLPVPHRSARTKARSALLKATQMPYWVDVDENIDFVLAGNSPIKKI